MIKVYLDTDENRIDTLALHAVHVDPQRWNGWTVPVVTIAEFRRFVTAWAHNDPNGCWVPAGVTETVTTVRYCGGEPMERLALRYDDGENEPEVWPTCGTDTDGTPLYAIDGWTWSL